MSKPRVAVIGLHGALGESTLAAFSSATFSSQVQIPVLAVTRDASDKTSSDIIEYVQGDIVADPETLAEKLAAVDVVISLTGSKPEILHGLESLLGKISPKVYIPSQFGTDTHAAGRVFPGFLKKKDDHVQQVRGNGRGIKVVNIATSLFAGGHWLRRVISQVGADVASKSVTYLGAPDQPFSYSKIEDIGRVVASVAIKSFQNPDAVPDRVRVHSGLLTREEVVATYERENSVVFEVKGTVPKEQVLQEAKEIWAEGFQGKHFLYYLNVLISQGEGLYFENNENELVNPGESLWTWGKY